MKSEGELPLFYLSVIGIPVGNLALGLLGEQKALSVFDKTIESLGVRWTNNAPWLFIDENSGGKHLRPRLRVTSFLEAGSPPQMTTHRSAAYLY